MTTIIENIDPKNPSREDLEELIKELKVLRKIDIHTVDINDLVDINSVTIHTELPVLERTIDYIKQIKNPYCYKMNDIVIKVSFLGERSINDCIKEALYGGGISGPEVARYGKGGVRY